MNKSETLKLDLIGKEFETTKSGKCFIIDYKRWDDVTVMFYEPMYVVKCEMGNLKKGNVNNPLYPNVFGVGCVGVGKYNGRDHKRCHRLWYNLLQRLFCENITQILPTYEGVTICKEWLNFQNFAEWCYSNDSFHSVDEDGSDVEIESCLHITHNLNTVLMGLDRINQTNYYSLIWRPDELFNCENGKVRVKDVFIHLPSLFSDLVFCQYKLEKHLPENGYGSFEWLYKFLCDYLKECCLHQNKYIYCCR